MRDTIGIKGLRREIPTTSVPELRPSVPTGPGQQFGSGAFLSRGAPYHVSSPLDRAAPGAVTLAPSGHSPCGALQGGA